MRIRIKTFLSHLLCRTIYISRHDSMEKPLFIDDSMIRKHFFNGFIQQGKNPYVEYFPLLHVPVWYILPLTAPSP